MTVMKAVVLTANQKMELQEITLAKLDDENCRIKIKNVGVCSSDIQRGFGGGAYFYPLIMGHELAGEVAEVGKNVKNFWKKDRVVIFPLLPCFKCEACVREVYAQCHDYSYYGSRQNGGYAEFIDVKPWNLIKIPSDISFQDAATTEPTSVVLHALKRAEVFQRLPKEIAIIGAGFLGLIMAQILQRKCPEVKITIIDRNQFKLDIAKKYVSETKLIKNEEEWQKFIDLEAKNKYCVVFEATGNPPSFSHSIEIVKHAGRAVWLGNITDDLTISKKNVSNILRKEIDIIGTWNSEYKGQENDDWIEALELMQEGLKPSEIVSYFIKLEEAPQILEKL
ncbi:MAG TPA: alcohol dehydrogenase catalytic domain-containing protein, partial [Rickettsiales bacterium]|nr:alcohol dehydrogenase catalytic domain-containing protein [Rickettsiales bacterium]